MTDAPPFPHDDAITVSAPETCPRSGFALSGAGSADRSRARPRTAPVAADVRDDIRPDGPSTRSGKVLRKEDLEHLRAQVRAIERHPAVFGPTDVLDRKRRWTLGCAHADEVLPSGLDPCGVHEVKPVASGAASAASCGALALGFALRLAVRRLMVDARPVVWCCTSAMAAESGRLYGPGLASLGLPPSSLLLVETARGSDALWTIEEALKSRAVALVLGVIDMAGLTEARRLSLAAESSATPCILVTGARHPETPATASRWRVRPMPADDPEPCAGKEWEAFRVCAALERLRPMAARRQDQLFALEWCDEAHRFRGPPLLAGREPVLVREGRGAGR